MRLSIVVISYNTNKLLKQCLQSIRLHCQNAEVIVVDNASSDQSAEMVRADFPDVKLICSDVNLGFARANNRGIREATGEFILLLNSDTVIEDGGLNACVEWFQRNPRVGATSPRLIGTDGRPQRCFHAFPSLRARLADAFSSSRIEKNTVAISEGWLAGTALLVRREALEQIGGTLDGTYWMYWEDADLSARLLKAGWQVTEYGEAAVKHHGGASGGGPDAARRSDLYAHYAWGEHRWLFQHRPIWESTAIWCLDAVDLLRRTARGCLRPDRRSDLAHAWILAYVLGCRLLSKRPPVPGDHR